MYFTPPRIGNSFLIPQAFKHRHHSHKSRSKITESRIALDFIGDKSKNATGNSSVSYASQKIFGLLMDLTEDFSKLEYTKLSFQRVFRIPRMRSELPKICNTLISNGRLQEGVSCHELRKVVDQLTTYKYLNNTHRAARILRAIFKEKDIQFIHSVKYSNRLLDFFLERNDEIMIKRIFRRLEKDDKKPNAMTFNLLGVHYLKNTSNFLERLMIWEFILLRMKTLGINVDLCSYYISLSLIPSEVPAKQELKQLMISHGLHLNVPGFCDIELTDMMNQGASLSEVLEYFHNAEGKLDTNCMNSAIFKYLQGEDDFKGAWRFMNIQRSYRDLVPRSSTVTIFTKYCIQHQRLALAVSILNTFLNDFGLSSSPALNIIMRHILTTYDSSDSKWINPLLKFIFIHHFKNSINNYQRTDVLFRQLKHEFGIELDKLPDFNDLDPVDRRIYDSLQSLVIDDSTNSFDDLNAQKLKGMIINWYLSGDAGHAIKENTKLELPIWLAEILAICSISDSSPSSENEDGDTTFLKLLEPEFFSPAFLNFLKSDALMLNLSPYVFYYRIVTKWSFMFGDVELVELISKALIDRACELNDLSFKLNDHFSGNNLEFMNNLDGFEKQLFKNSHKSYKDLKSWWLQKPS
ncbi:hypothetical protein OGAPHI_001300 [Ogataea philodendri]|uniref:DNA replication complex GINS protein PSF3 n=1 Tax=Ogataea philodendri TaxID=1378263 RepID=A0A9P8PGD3_9ASCO|nr:uncharacterized protein OGAPHI_001300 [Ogataea philodendri]KAH3670784.1 hypothetical protein OGAPHI_001300 [Ogataea philodendri]